jgi:hypothetical protein
MFEFLFGLIGAILKLVFGLIGIVFGIVGTALGCLLGLILLLALPFIILLIVL